MEGAIIIILLVGLALPITMVAAALVFDAVIALWATYRTLHDRPAHR